MTASKQASTAPLVCHGHTRPVPELNFSHNTDDGYFLVSACKDGKAMLRRGEDGTWIGTFDGHANACVWSCTLNKPALLAATASADFTCKLWNAISGEELRSWDHPHIVRSCHFSAESSQLATAAHDKAIRVFDVATEQQKEQISEPRRHPESGALQDTLRAVRWAADDKLIMMSYQNSPGVDVLDMRTGDVCQQWKTEAPVTSMNLSYCGNFVTLAAGTDVAVYECSSKSMKQVGAVKALQQVESAHLSPDKQHMVVGGKDMWAYVLDFPSGKPVMVHKGHHGPIWSLQFAHDGQSFATASEDGTVRIWSAANRESA